MDQGVYINDGGYLQLYMPEHPDANKGYILVHRYMMEQHIGRYLQNWEVVHHIDFNKLNNDISNLYLTTNSEHIRIHNRAEKLSQDTKLKIRRKIREHRRNQKNER